MSFLDDIVDTGKSLLGGIFGGDNKSGGSGIVGSLLSTALTGFALYKVNQSVSTPPAPTISSPPDLGNHLSIEPDPQQKIPVVYGTAYLPGIITDAVASDNNLTMTYVVTLCEKTGTLLSDNTDSTFDFLDVYWNNNRIVFNGDGVTANYTTDADGNVDNNINGLVHVYCFNGSSLYPVVPVGYENNALSAAYGLVPNWDNTYMMNDLIFAVVKVSYNRDKGITDLPSISFNLRNSMTLPGDCIQDYMTNARYGAGIDLGEIYSE